MAEVANPFIHDIKTTNKNVGLMLINFLQGLVILLAIIVICYLFLVIPNQVDGQSMEPNFHDRELLLTNKIIQIVGDKGIGKKYNYDYRRGDVVIFQLPNYPDFIKRVIGLPGDEILIEDNTIYVNGKALEEAYIPSSYKTKGYDFVVEGVPQVIPEGHYALFGDNRENSKDSRFEAVGFVSREYIKGRVFFRWWPMDRIGSIGQGDNGYEE